MKKGPLRNSKQINIINANVAGSVGPSPLVSFGKQKNLFHLAHMLSHKAFLIDKLQLL